VACGIQWYDSNGVIVQPWWKTIRGALAVLAAAAVLFLAVSAAGHWHSQPSEDEHCRICHYWHSPVTVELTLGVILPLPEPVAQLAVRSTAEPTCEIVVHPVSLRGPPVA
jgi:hypothetical protein